MKNIIYMLFLISLYSDHIYALTPCFLSTWNENQLAQKSSCNINVSWKNESLKKFNEENKKICDDGCGNLIGPTFLDKNDEIEYKARLKKCKPRYNKILSKYKHQINQFASDKNCEVKWDKFDLNDEYVGKSHLRKESYTCSNKKEYDVLREVIIGFQATWRFVALCSKDTLKKDFYDTSSTLDLKSEDITKCKNEDSVETRLCFYEYKALNESNGVGDIVDIVHGPDVFYNKDINCEAKKNLSKKTSDYATQYRNQGKTSIALEAKGIADRQFARWVEVCKEKAKKYKDEEPMGVNKN